MATWDVIPPWVRKQGRPVTLSEIAERFNRTHHRAMKEVIKLVDSGELIDLGGDQITAPARKWDRPPTECPPVQARIWRAICNRNLKGGAWTAKDIARIAEADLKYTQDYLAWLRRRGHVNAHRKPPAAYRYRLDPDAPPISQPPIWWNRRNRALRRRQKEKDRAADRPPAPRGPNHRPKQQRNKQR